MKVTCILLSFNRPRFILQSLKSIANQTHQDYQLIIMDESTTFDVHKVASTFKFTEVDILHSDVTSAGRYKTNRIGINLNVGLARARGDLVCFLCDDDYYYPEWFENASMFFETHPKVSVAFGKLMYSPSLEMTFPVTGNVRFFPESLNDPFNRLDHNQVIHRRFTPPYRWPEDVGTIYNPDAYYFNSIAQSHRFWPIDAWAVVKRIHPKQLQQDFKSFLEGQMENLRE